MLQQKTPIRLFSFIRCLAVLLIAASLLGLQPVPGARAAPITVDTLADNESDGCGTNNCTLREAITDAGNGATINFSVTGTITLTSGQLTIDKDLTITGPGAVQLTISGGGSYRVFYIDSGATVIMSGLTIADGWELSGDGGGIFNQGTLTITDSTLSYNTTSLGEGGGIFNEGALTITNSTLFRNEAVSANGGGISNRGDLTITNSTFSDNKAHSGGGGAFIWTGSVTIENSTFSDNTTAFDGGGIFHLDGDLTISNSTISDNTADSTGGGIYNRGTLTIADSTISSNTAGSGGGGIYIREGTVTIENSTISGNTADNFHGGGIYNQGKLTIENSTLSGNQSGKHGGGLYVQYVGSKTFLYNVTISANVADTGDGGGVYRSAGQFNFENSVIAGNQDGSSSGNVRPDCSGTLTSGGYNLIEDTSGCTIDGDTTGNLTGQAALLDALADNGGETETHALGDGSPAIDAGNPDGCQDDDGNDLTTDQRGEPRPAGGICDIGAYEKQGPDLEAVKTNDVGDAVTLGSTFQWTVTISNTSSQDVVFSGGQPIETIFQDDLPAGATYGAPTVQNVTDVTNSGHIDCQLIGTTLMCDPVGADVTLLAETGTFDVVFDVTPSATGDLTNPDTNGVCQVDPDDHVAEINESDNACTDTVTVTAADGGADDGSGDDNDTGGGRPSRNCPVGVPGGICRLRNLVKVTVFENTVSDGSSILIQEKAGGQFQLGDRVFDVTIVGPDGGAIATFDPPIEVCLRPSNAELKAAGWHYGNLTLFHSHAGGPWEAIYNTYEKDGKLCAKVWQLSRFALGVSPLPDTGFAPGVEHALPAQPAEKAYVDLLGVTASEAWQSPRQGGDRFVVQSTPRGDNFVLEIPSLGLELPIVGVPLSEDGWDVRWLGSQAGWLQGTAFPTWAGNTAITAHVWDADNNPGPFVDLGTLQHGDEIIIHAWGLVHTYEVRGVERVRPDDLRALPHEDYDVLTLLTCQGFDETSKAYDWRLAVRAVLMDVEVE
jgi:LPXTG-site transpeptidase (sortase) family protein